MPSRKKSRLHSYIKFYLWTPYPKKHHILNIFQLFLKCSIIQLHLPLPLHPKNVPILYFLLFLPYMHVFIVFFCHCNHATARCSQDGIIGENVCAAYFSQGLSLANYCLDGSQRFSPITCIFPVSRVDVGQGSARTVSVVLSLAMVLPLSREVAHSGM